MHWWGSFYKTNYNIQNQDRGYQCKTGLTEVIISDEY